MFTANSMNCLLEAIGLALPGNGTIPAVDPRRLDLARAAARQIIELLRRDLKPRDIVTLESLDNAFALDMAMGGSTNTVLHTLAIAHEAGVDFPLARLNADLRGHPLHLQGLAVRARTCTSRTWTAPAASAPSSRNCPASPGCCTWTP